MTSRLEGIQSLAIVWNNFGTVQVNKSLVRSSATRLIRWMDGDVVYLNATQTWLPSKFGPTN
jgi:hypothetical protein